MFQTIAQNIGECQPPVTRSGHDRSLLRRLVVIAPGGAPQGKIAGQLEKLGFELVVLPESLEAFDKIDAYKETAEAIILDWRHDQAKQPSIAEALARKSAEIGVPVLALAAASREADIQTAYEAGLFHLVAMPCQLCDVKAAIDSLTRHKRAAGEASRFRLEDALGLLETCKFRFRTPADVDRLVPLIAQIFPEPRRAAPGVAELMMNAIEHGNLEIGHERKAEWVARGIYQGELVKRLQTPPYSSRWAEVIINRRDDGVMIVIMDQGCGFCWQNVVEKPGAGGEAADTTGGIARAKAESFDDLRFNHLGNQVTALVAKEHAA